MTPEEMSKLGFSEKAKEALAKVSNSPFVSMSFARVLKKQMWLPAGEDRGRDRQR
jgi:hypothetical protein